MSHLDYPLGTATQGQLLAELLYLSAIENGIIHGMLCIRLLQRIGTFLPILLTQTRIQQGLLRAGPRKDEACLPLRRVL